MYFLSDESSYLELAFPKVKNQLSEPSLVVGVRLRIF